MIAALAVTKTEIELKNIYARNMRIIAVLPIQEAEKPRDMLYQGENVGEVVLTVE